MLTSYAIDSIFADNSSTVGSNLKAVQSVNLIAIDDNKGILEFKISATGLENQINWVLSKSGVKKANTEYTPTLNDLRNGGSPQTIDIDNVKTFFEDSQLAKFKISGQYSDGVKILEKLKGLKTRDEAFTDQAVSLDDINLFLSWAKDGENVAEICKTRMQALGYTVPQVMIPYLTGERSDGTKIGIRESDMKLSSIDELTNLAITEKDNDWNRIKPALQAAAQGLCAASIGTLHLVHENGVSYFDSYYRTKYAQVYNDVYLKCQNLAENKWYNKDVAKQNFEACVTVANNHAQLDKITDSDQKKQIAVNIAALAAADLYYDYCIAENIEVENFVDASKKANVSDKLRALRAMFYRYDNNDMLGGGQFTFTNGNTVQLDDKIGAYVACISNTAIDATYTINIEEAEEFSNLEYQCVLNDLSKYCTRVENILNNCLFPVVFNSKTQELTYDDSLTGWPVSDNKFKLRTDVKATLSYEDNIITFTIPIEFPEEAKIQTGTEPFKSFTVRMLEKSEFLN